MRHLWGPAWLLAALLTALAASREAAPAPPMLKIAIVDTGLDLTDPRFAPAICLGESRDFTGEGMTDSIGHGTHVTGIIRAHAGEQGYCLMILKYYSDRSSGSENLDRELTAFKYAVAHGADFVNFSGGGPEANDQERAVIAGARGTTFVVAAGNEHRNIDLPEYAYYPAAYRLPNVVVVGALARDGTRLLSSNWSARAVWEPGDRILSATPGGGTAYLGGTSMAAATRTGRLINDRLRR